MRMRWSECLSAPCITGGRGAPRLAALLAVLCSWVSPVAAQAPLSDVLSFLLINRDVPTGDFERDADAARATRDTMSRLLLVEVSTQPVSVASPGFVYRLNPAIGAPERASGSFGPFFTDRSLTTGAGRLTFGAAYTSRTFTTLDGEDLRDGSFVASGNQFRDESKPFDVETLALSLSTQTLTLAATAGVGDRVDVSVAVPFVSLSLEGRRLNIYRGASVVQATADAEASGVGDVAVRSKVRLLGTRGTGLAALGELRLPTGREQDLLGAGSTAVAASIVGSVERGPFSAHGSAGATRGGLADGWNYRLAVTASPATRVTLVGELLGRRLEEAGRVALTRSPHPSIAGVDTLRLLTDGAGSHAAFGVIGAKWNVRGTWLVGAHLSWPLTDAGLRPDRALVLSGEYSWQP